MVAISNAQFLSLQEIIGKCNTILCEESLQGYSVIEDLAQSCEKYSYLVYQEDNRK